MPPFTNTDIRKAYLFLKNYFYYDSIDILAKQQIAQYEAQHQNLSIDNFWQQLEKDVKERYQHQNFDIDFYIVPKKIQDTAPEEKEKKNKGSFLHNVKEQDRYIAEEFTYFIKADVATRVLDVLWIMKVGTQVDQTFDNQHIYANRLSAITEIANEKSVSPLFKFYPHQYSAWRDQALDTAKKLLANGNNILMLSMDIKQCFYNIHIDWNKFQQQFKDQTDLTTCLQKIHNIYFQKILSLFPLSHSIFKLQPILPIGLLSSGILANWYLKDFDDAIISSSNPIFYGRYVDDILLVRTTSEIKPSELKFQEAFKACFSKEIFKEQDNMNVWTEDESIQLQKEKLIVHYFDAKHSAAGLKVFEKEINKNNSLFRFLPTTETQPRLEEVAYDLFYYGSKYKFRSLINFKENATKFSTYLSGQIILHRLTNNKKNDSVIEDVKLFFKGRNCLDFYRFWNKFFYFLVIRHEDKAIWEFYQDVDEIINKTYTRNFHLIPKIRESLSQILDISLSLALALNPKKIPQNLQCLRTTTLDLQQSNLFVNTYVKDPLINFTFQEECGTSYLSPLLKENNSLDDKKLRLSPRFIHLDEFILFKIWPNLLQNKPIKEINNILEEYRQRFGMNYQGNINCSESDSILNITVKDSANNNLFAVKNFTKSIRIGLVNMSVDLGKDTLPCIEKQGKFPNLSEKRQNILYDIINLATKENVNLLIFPELSIPFSWLPAMLYHSRKTQIGFIFGLEYAYNPKGQEAYNYVVTTLPFIHNRYKTVLPLIRLKNHYAPEEKNILEGYFQNPPIYIIYVIGMV